MELLDDLNSGKFNLIFFGIIFVFIFHQYWCVSIMQSCDKKEPMSNISVDIKEAIKQVYVADVQAIRNLAEIANKLQKEGLTIPGNLTVKGELRVDHSNFLLGNKEKDQWIFHAPPDDRGGLWISRVQRDGNVNWGNGLNMLTSADGTQNIGGNFNLVPRGTVVAWTGTTAPAGWAICNGGNGTPNLQNRFVLGLGSKGINSVGGEETVTLNVNQIPSHTHAVNDWAAWNTSNQQHGRVYHRGQYYIREQNQKGGPEDHNALYDSESTASGGGQAHNNMPPFYVLAFIMKL